MDYKSESKGERERETEARPHFLTSLSHFASDVGCRVPLGHGGEAAKEAVE